jgi:hypothetical protein
MYLDTSVLVKRYVAEPTHGVTVKSDFIPWA